jgi:hypothetical protein
MRRGQRITVDQSFADEEVAAMDENGDLVGVLVRRNDSWKPQLVLGIRDESASG